MNKLPIIKGVLKELDVAIQKHENCSIFGLSLGEKALFLCGQNRQIVFVTNSVSDANKVVKIFESFGKVCKTIFFTPNDYFSLSSSFGKHITDILHAMYSLCKKEVDVLVISPITLMQKYTPKTLFEKSIISLKSNKTYSQKELIQNLISLGYRRVDAVMDKGEFSVRGDIIDIFEILAENPTRIEFFDDEVETIYQYNIEDFKKIKELKQLSIAPIGTFMFCDEDRQQIYDTLSQNFDKTFKGLEPNAATKLRTNFEEFKINFDAGNFDYVKNWVTPFAKFSTIVDYISDDAIVVFDDVKQIVDTIKKEYDGINELYKSMLSSGEIIQAQSQVVVSQNEVFNFDRQMLSFQQITTSNKIFNPTYVASFKASAETNYFGNFELLCEDLRYYLEFHNTVIISCASKQLAQYLEKFLQSKSIDAQLVKSNDLVLDSVNLIVEDIPYGAIFVEDKIVIIGSLELQRKKAQKKVSTEDKKEEFTLPKIGDYVVHESYGIGQCVGIEKLKFTDYQKDYIILRYDNGDKVYLPTEQIGLISTYISNGKPPKLNKLGTKDFENTKAKVKSSLKELAFNLVELYSKRQKLRGVKYEVDSKLYAELENSFPYEETSDQISAINDILNDMTAGKVMDRIVCGDVGYGKTEVAVRSAFVAALNNKQVAFLAPTTVLSQQHFNTAKSRLQNFGITVECLNRFKTKSEQKEILKKLQNGEIDVLCGTHRLLSKDVVFKDLGLLVLDEEQRFGVGDKEKIKTLKANVDVLTLSATPIPRTLHMGLVGIRDISIIATPPQNRMPVQTTVAEFSDAILQTAINRELARGGQVLVIYNKVETIVDFSQKVKSLVPKDTVVSFAHGQMDSDRLENEILNLYNGATKILVSTTLIENGIDLPNANTLFVVDADKLGLSQLYQLKGRVGRSKNLGYAYFTFKRDKMLSSDAYKRLNAIMEFTELGSGFKIAMRDLEIRGCGNILGAEQSGHMAKVGYDMYCKILNQVVGEIKGQKQKEYKEIKLDIAANCFIPENYIKNSDERFRIYTNLKQIDSNTKKQQIVEEIQKLYGNVPQEIQNLAMVAMLRNIAREFDVKRILIDRERAVAEFYDRETMLNKNIAAVLNELGIKNYFSQTGIQMNFALSEFSVKRKLELIVDIFEKALCLARKKDGTNKK